MIEIDWRALLLLFAGTSLLLLSAIGRWRAWRRSAHARKRGARSVRGEHAAEGLLERAGYTIIGRQQSRVWTLYSNGERMEFLLRADLLVRLDGQEYIAEVKTGKEAPRLSNASTRRQLLEYSLAFDSPTVLLVDVENQNISEVQFGEADGD